MTLRMTFVPGVACKWQHRLKVEERRGRIPVTDSHVPIALQWNTDQVGYGILRLPGQFVDILCQCPKREQN